MVTIPLRRTGAQALEQQKKEPILSSFWGFFF